MGSIDIRKVLVIGSGAIKIAEAAEFDYSGSQALKALKEEGIETILVNPNIATIQTSYRLADHVYLGPLKPWFLEKVIEKERPDGVLLGFGGQTALSLGVELHRRRILERYGIKVLGTPIEGIEKALERSLFRKTMIEKGLPIPPSIPAKSEREVLEAAKRIGFPVIVRVSFNLGGGGSFIAWSMEELLEKIPKAFAQSGSGEVLVEKYLHFWKEIEYEVVRDSYGNSAAVACLENLDPMGVHTGDSVVVAPCQTLSDQEYQLLRRASIEVAEAISLVGECNVQLALSPSNTWDYYVIETNPRMSRSSALASKATGYPLAYIAAKLALGYRLDELLNKVTRRTCACFEPSLDYIVVKIPRWDFDKFYGVNGTVNSEMKSIGEVMAIGRNFAEALQKAIRMLDIGEPGLVAGSMYEADDSLQEIIEKLKKREPYWPIHAARAFRKGASIEEVYNATGVDKFFLEQIKSVVDLAEILRNEGCKADLVAEAKRMGFSDEQLSKLCSMKPDKVLEVRRAIGVELPVVRQVDTLAAEWPAESNYLYTTYNGYVDDIKFSTSKKIIVLGAGVFRIGVSVEFDWAVVSFAQEAMRRGYETIIINYNPETVSTDWDMSDKLYFEELSLERVLDIYKKERPLGVVAFLGGQIANKLAKKLEEQGVRLLGTRGYSVHRAENRYLFSKLVEQLGLHQPPWIEARSIKEAKAFTEEVGYPVLIRPSYVLSGSAMAIAYNEAELEAYLAKAYKLSPEHPVVVSKFIDDAIEAEIDAVGDSRSIVGSVIEHIEPAGVHSGDSTMVLPWFSLPEGIVKSMVEAAIRLNTELEIKGPFNIQFLAKNDTAYIIELNLRASRSMPFTSKVTGFDLIEAAARIVLDGEELDSRGEYRILRPSYYGVKSPQFSWARLRGAYPSLGPEMKSTGESASLGKSFEEALLKSWLSVEGNDLPPRDKIILVYSPVEKGRRLLAEAAGMLHKLGYSVMSIEGMEVDGVEALPASRIPSLLREKRIGLVATTGSSPTRDYWIRRTAADLKTPLVLDARLAYCISKALYVIQDLESLKALELKEYWTSMPFTTFYT